jgi:hypothetical protein
MSQISRKVIVFCNLYNISITAAKPLFLYHKGFPNNLIVPLRLIKEPSAALMFV